MKFLLRWIADTGARPGLPTERAMVLFVAMSTPTPKEVEDLVSAAVQLMPRLQGLHHELSRESSPGSDLHRIAVDLEDTTNALEGYVDRAHRALNGYERRSRRRLPRWQADLLHALQAGQLAGLLLGLGALVFYAVFLHKSPLRPLLVIASVVLGEGVIDAPTLGAAMTGVVVHLLGPTLFWSVIFGVGVSLMAEPPSLTLSVLGGILLGAIAEMFDVYLIMPFIQYERNGHNVWAEHVMLYWDWLAHVIWGGALAGGYWWLTDRQRRHRRR